VGLTLALTGAGGGIVALPLLVFALNLEKDARQATSANSSM